MDILRHALALAAQYVPVFFCNSDKRPTTPRGFYNATIDPQVLAEMYRLRPGPLLGVPTGSASGFDILDLDAKHGSAAAWWETHRQQMPTTRPHRTRSQGLHLLFQHAPANALAPSGDLARRFIICELDPQCEDPEARPFKTGFLEGIQRRRIELLAAVLTIWR